MDSFERDVIWRELILLYDERDAALWMDMPHPQLEGRSPIDCSFEEVKAVIDRLNSGAFL